MAASSEDLSGLEDLGYILGVDELPELTVDGDEEDEAKVAQPLKCSTSPTACDVWHELYVLDQHPQAPIQDFTESWASTNSCLYAPTSDRSTPDTGEGEDAADDAWVPSGLEERARPAGVRQEFEK